MARKLEPVGPDGTIMGGKRWFGARGIFQDKETGIYSERVTITAERDAASAIRASKTAFRRYARWTKSRWVHGRTRRFPLFDTGRPWSKYRRANMNGIEVFRHAVANDLSPDEYLDRCFDTGSVEVPELEGSDVEPVIEPIDPFFVHFEGVPGFDEQWWSVRTFHDHRDAGQYVERVTIGPAATAREAVLNAEEWARNQGEVFGAYMNSAQSHGIWRPGPPSFGEGVFSWERQSDLKGSKFLDRYFPGEGDR